MAEIDRKVMEAGRPADWRWTEEEREALRRSFIVDVARPLWVFAYGSLIWDPSMLFDEVRTARAPRHARHFCLWDEGGRGSVAQPGLQVALDEAAPGEPGCDGLVFRIPDDRFEEETYILWRREMIAHAYRPEIIDVETPAGPLRAVAFLADHAADAIRAGIEPVEQARMIAGAAGAIGRNCDYLENLVMHLEAMGIEDAALVALRDRVREFQALDGVRL